MITKSLKPTREEKYNQDLHLRFAEAIDRYNIRARDLQGDEKPVDVAREIVGSLTDEKHRTAAGLARPRYYTADEYNYGTLEEAQRNTADAYSNKEISEEQYSYEIRLIQQHFDYLKEANQISPTMQKEIDRRRR